MWPAPCASRQKTSLRAGFCKCLKRSDIWAFGAALYEMLAGKRPFEGRDVSEVLGGVLRLDPDWDALPSDTPPHLTAYLKRCLEKEPRQRVHDIADVRLAMEGAFETAVTVSSGPVDAPQLQIWQRPIPLVIAGLLLALVSSLAVWTLTRAEVVPADVVRFSIVLPDSAPVSIGNRGNLVISRDGTQVIYSGRQQLNLRPLGQLVGAPIRGGEGGLGPFVSPDGEWVGFLDTTDFRTIKRVPIIGGQSVTLTESPGGFYGASWGTDDQIVFGTTSGLFRVSGGGGEPEALTTIDTEEGETGHTWPFIIPGREAVLFATRASTFGTERLAVLDLRTGERTPLGLAGTNPHYVPTGHLVYVGADGSVRAVAFDATSLEVSGNAVTLVEGVARSRTGAAFSISDNGRLVYVLGPGPEGARKSLVWVDRGGGEELVAAEPANYQEFNLSPDGTRVAIRIIGDEPAVWIYDLTRDNPTRLTFGSDDVGALYPTWTADSAHVAFGPPLSWKRADGTGEVETLSDAPQQFPQAFSPDGTLVFVEDLGGRRLGILTLEGDRTSTLILSEEFSSTDATLSPDGRWLAYRSNETGQREVYVVPFPDVGTGKWQISTDGGVWPLWSQAANELFYMGPDGVMALEFQADTTFTPGAPTLLFERANPIGGNRDMAVSQDGQRFLLFTDNMVAPGDEDAEPSQIHVALNWFQELTERVPTN